MNEMRLHLKYNIQVTLDSKTTEWKKPSNVSFWWGKVKNEKLKSSEVLSINMSRTYSRIVFTSFVMWLKATELNKIRFKYRTDDYYRI